MTDMRSIHRTLGIAALVAATTSCGDVIRNGRSPSYLVIDSLNGIQGKTSVGTPSATLTSDVITNVISPAPCTPQTPCPTVFADSGQAAIHIALKDAGTGASAPSPVEINAITIDRVHVDYVRTDGRNTQGVDVPYSFDGAVTVTVTGSATTFGFPLVRIVAKEESPLVQLKNSSSFITMIATVTFYGHDQAGNAASVSGQIQIDFGNFGDT
jgi:hypothetical protein